MSRETVQNAVWSWRSIAAVGLFVVVSLALLSRAIYLQVVDKKFLVAQGKERHLRVEEIPAHRGMILDRNGEPLAVSTPVDSIWMNPQELDTATQQLPELAQALGLKTADVKQMLRRNPDKQFVYLARDLDPYVAQKVIALKIPGVYSQREFRRYYPTGEVTAHVLGFTNVDDRGQEGLELAYDNWLRGIPGAERVIVDRFGHSVQDVDSLRSPRPGKDLTTSIDLRVQYLAYRALKQAVLQQNAKSGSIIVMDAKTGEVLAMANQPSFNPNNRDDYIGNLYRNRAVTDQFEPGSSMKPFTIIAALLSGKYHPGSMINTSPGYYKVSGYTISDDGHDYGDINLTTLIEKSSNVGASKIALSLQPQLLWDTLNAFGFGRATGSGFPGEVAGALPPWESWTQARRATISYGYGVAITALQLADAYDTLADSGIRHTPSFVKLDVPQTGERVIPVAIDHDMRSMLEAVVSDAGTGARADVAGYHVAGKTGTARIAENGGYSTKNYISVFAGMAPATNPQLVAVVVIRDPSKGEYFASTVAAPVFAHVMTGALRLLDIPPDNLGNLTTTAYIVNLGHRS